MEAIHYPNAGRPSTTLYDKKMREDIMKLENESRRSDSSRDTKEPPNRIL
uniref:Uncharacterized protein n=1 Tax=Nelumbo nucifera TaxID=4432 RepID=A0A822ZSM8_NELNU|nr:TPA_asm: hypothetical protein HUJ06_017824 [Nelumbo nucifera]